MSTRQPINCDGCTQCCQWGHDASLIPDPSLKMDTQTGNCAYLGQKGCMIYATRPQACRDFDCRNLVDQVLQSPGYSYLKILVVGAKKIDQNA